MTGPLSKTSVTTCTAVPPLPTPTYPSGGTWSILATSTISAPLSKVIEASLDVSTWPKWNTFVSKAEITSEVSPTAPKLSVGTNAMFYSKMKENETPTATLHQVVSIDKFVKDGNQGCSIIWKSSGTPGGETCLRVERVQEFVEIKREDGSVVTEYKTWGTFGGPLAYIMSWMGIKSTLVTKFRDWTDGLKVYVETPEA